MFQSHQLRNLDEQRASKVENHRIELLSEVCHTSGLAITPIPLI